MTVIAWDGATLAADRHGETGWLKTTRLKIRRIEAGLVGGAGKFQVVCAIVNWIEAGRVPADWPKCADDDANSIVLLVQNDGLLFLYESGPYTVPLPMPFIAIGAGAEAAMAAMHLGCDAKRAVEVAGLVCKGCGNGVDTLTL